MCTYSADAISLGWVTLHLSLQFLFMELGIIVVLSILEVQWIITFL